jgi:hypothetical protein
MANRQTGNMKMKTNETTVVRVCVRAGLKRKKPAEAGLNRHDRRPPESGRAKNTDLNTL